MKAKLKSALSLNWAKTLYINFKLLPFGTAIKLPILIKGKCRLDLTNGKVEFNVPIRKGIVKIGHRYETFSYKEPVQFILNGRLTVNGEVWIGTGVHLLVEQGAHLAMGEMSSIGSLSSLTCSAEIVFSDYARIGSSSEITDCNYHFMKNLTDHSILPIKRKVFIGSRNYIGSRVALLPGTITPNNITIGYGTVCNKDYRPTIPENSLIAGVPARLVKENVVRIFDFEKEAEIARYFAQTGNSVYYDTPEA